MTQINNSNPQVRIEFDKSITRKDMIQIDKTMSYWLRNRAITNAESKPHLEWSSDEKAVHVDGNFETGNCWRKHGRLSEDWLKPLNDKKRRGYDVTSLLNKGKVNTSKEGEIQEFFPLVSAKVTNVFVVM